MADVRDSPLFDYVVEENINILTKMYADMSVPPPDAVKLKEMAETVAVDHLERTEAFYESPEGKAWWREAAKRCEVDPNNIPRIKVKTPDAIKTVITGANGAITPWPTKKEVEP